jgi:amino acid transporter
MGVEQSMRPAELRRRFLLAFWWELKIVWPILSALVAIQLALGLLVGYREGWTINDATYFTFVTGLTIGYGDLVPAHFGTRLISIMIGLIGILLTGLVAAVGVRALLKATEHEAR